MERGSYVAASGGFRQIRRLDSTTHDLANVNTVGYKREVLVGSSQRFADTFASIVAKNDPYAEGDHERTPGTVDLRSLTDFSPGAIQETGKPLDVALRSQNEFFVVQGSDGQQQFTRAGNFTLSEDGTLVTPDGLKVLGDGGELLLNGVDPTISSGGIVRAGGQTVGKVQVVKIEDPASLERVDGTRFRPKLGEATPVNVDLPEMISGSLEMSNVSIVSGMVDMIAANRGFEMYTKVAQTIDELNQLAISRVGKKR